MSEIYPLRASGELAGMFCEINQPKPCKQYARFCLSSAGDKEARKHLACGHHVGVIAKGMFLVHKRSVVIQEIPGAWIKSNEVAAIDGHIVSLTGLSAGKEKGNGNV